MGKKGKKPSGEQQRRISLQDGEKQEMSCVQKESLQSYNTFNEYDRVYESCVVSMDRDPERGVGVAMRRGVTKTPRRKQSSQYVMERC